MRQGGQKAEWILLPACRPVHPVQGNPAGEARGGL